VADAKIVLSAEDRTRTAFEQAKRNLAGITVAARGVITAFGPIAAVASAAAAGIAAINIKGAIDLADDLGKLSQRSGVAVENLSALRFAGELADVSLDQLGDALKKLNQNIAAAARGEKEQAEAFKTLGIAVKDAAGQVRSADDILGDLADRFAGYADGANKVALANAVGGRSFEALIPLLNGGRKGIADARAELEKYGGVVSGDLAKKSEQFNDNITRLGVAVESLKVKVAGELIDNLVKLSGKFVKASQDGNLLLETLKQFGSFALSPASFAYKLFFGSGAEASGNTALTRLEDEAKRLQGLMIGVQNTLAREPDNKAALKSLDQLSTKLASVNAQAVELKSKNFTTGARRPANEGGGKFLPQAPALPGPKDTKADQAAAEALAALRKLADNRVKVIQQGVEEEVDAARFREQILGIQYSQANVSLAAFYAQQDKLRADALDATRRAVAAEIAVRQEELKAKDLKPADKRDIEQQITDARAKLAKAEREAGQDAQRAAEDRKAATAELAAGVRQLQAEIAALGGDRTAQPLVDVAERVAAARKLLTQALPAGTDPAVIEAEVQKYERLLKLQIALGQARQQFGIISERLQISEERIALAQQTGAIGEIEALQRIGQARQAVIGQLQEQLAAQEAIAAVTQDPEILLGIERTRLELEKLNASLDPLKDKFDNLFKDSGATFLEDLFGGKGLKAAARNAVNVIAGELNRTIAKDASAAIFGPGGILGGAGKAAAGIFGGRPNGIDGGFAGSFGIDAAKEAADKVAKAGFSLEGVFGSLQTAAGGSADVLGSLPQLAAIPATASITALGAAAQIASASLAQLSASASLGSAGAAAGSSGFGLLGLGGLIGGGGGFGSGANFGNQDLGLFLHKGGIAGRDGSPTRYHGGGIAGLRPDEVPAILQRGEEVLPRNSPRHRDNGTVNNNGVMDRAAEERAAQTIARRASAFMRRHSA
jgi:hypothetical protein